MSQEIIKAKFAGTFPALDFPNDGKLPDDFQFMPPGEHTISASVAGEPKKLRVKVTAKTAETLDGVLQMLRAGFLAGEEDEPMTDFNHNDDAASSHPQKFFWGGDDPKKGGVRCKTEWTASGSAAVLGKDYRRFSPEFYVNASGEVTGAGVNLGALVNRAAFKKIASVLAKEAQPKNKMTEQEMQAAIAAKDQEIASLKNENASLKNADAVKAKETEIADLNKKITTLESAAKVQAKETAKATVATAVAAGKIEPKNTTLIAHYEELLVSAPVQAKAIIDALPVNPALATVIPQPGNPGAESNPAKKEHDFVVKAKEVATKENISEGKAQEKLARSNPQLYQAWRDSLGS